MQLRRAADEMTKYLYAHGARRIQISLDFARARSYCAISAPDLVLKPEEIERLSDAFSGPIQPEIAAYYGSLAGDQRDEAEIELLATMTELEELFSMEGAGTKIVLSRRESEYYGA